MRRVTLILVGAFVFLFTLSNQTNAAAPQLINYQGRVTDSAGVPLDGPFDIVQFTIYDAASAGNAIWFEEHTTIVVTDGLFSVLLGSVTELVDTVFNDTSRYLGISLDGGVSEIVPRTRLVAAPYAFRVNTVDGASGGTIFGDVEIQSKLTVDSVSAGDADISGDLTVSGNIIGSTPWTPIPLSAGYNAWADSHGGPFARPEYRKIGDIVYLRGIVHKIDHATIPAGAVIAILPAGFRPAFRPAFDNLARVDIFTSGEVFLQNGGAFEGQFLDGISFSTSP